MDLKLILSFSRIVLLAAIALPVSSVANEAGTGDAASTADGTTASAETETEAPASESGFRFRSKAAVRDERRGQFYVAGFGGISYSAETEDPELNISNPAGIIGGTQELSLSGDGNKFVAGFKVGYETSGYQPEGVDFLVIRPALEIEFMYAPQSVSGSSTFISSTTPTTNIGTATYQQDMDIFTIMLNPIARFQLFDRYTPYVGGGFGAALLEADAPSGVFVGASTFGSGTDEEIALTLQAIAGFEVDIIHGISVFTEYKFHYMRDISFSYANTTLGASAKVDYTDMTRHMITGGLKYKF